MKFSGSKLVTLAGSFTSKRRRSSLSRFRLNSFVKNWRSYCLATTFSFALSGCQVKPPAQKSSSIPARSPSISSPSTSASSQIPDSGSFPSILLQWILPSKDSSQMINNFEILTKTSWANPVKMIEVMIDGKVVSGYNSPNVLPIYESDVISWGAREDFFFLTRITDADFDTGYHALKIGFTDSLGGYSFITRVFRMVRSVPASYWNPETLSVRAGWNLVSPGKRMARASGTASIPPGAIASSFFGYGTNYTSADTLLTTRGYWIKLSTDARLIFNAVVASSKLSPQARKVNPPSPPSFKR